MYTHQLQNLHVWRRGLSGLGAAIPLQLTIDSPYQQVGVKGKFRIIGAPPGAVVNWSSFKDGQATGELNAAYGQQVESNGTAELEWTPLPEHVGEWTKQILVQDASGANYTAMVNFRVIPATATTEQPQATGAASFLQSGFNVGSTFIPYWMPLAAAGAFFVFKRR